MNNVWSSIACKAPCAARQAHRKPLLQLFNGFARYQICQVARRKSVTQVIGTERTLVSAKQPPCSLAVQYASRRNFSNCTRLLARGRRSKQPAATLAPKNSSASKLEEPPTVASHTEGLSEEPEELTWRDYDPEGGMPLTIGELPQPDINAVFGSEEIDADTGNYILNVMHWRRMSGALIDDGLKFPKGSDVSRNAALKGLEYVRTLDPGFDETAAGQRWAEEESERLRQELQERAVNLGIYRRVETEAEEDQQGTEYGRERSGESFLQRQREEKEAAYEVELAEKKAKQEREEVAAVNSARGPLELEGGVQPVAEHNANAGVAIGRPKTDAWLQPVERKPWVKYYEEQAQIIKDNAVPQMSTFARLTPSLLVALVTLTLCVYVSNNYTPPPTSARMFPDYPPAVATIGALTAALLGMFVLGRVPPLWRTYSKYFTLVPAYPYSISVLGAAFRHDTFLHLTSNLISLWLFGLVLHEDVGRGTFLAIYFGSGVVGGYAGLLYNVLNKQFLAYIFGSSGCVIGVVAAACALRPNGTVIVAGYELPLAAWMFLAVYGTAEVVAAVRMRKTTIDHAGHIGGLLAGIAGAMYIRSKGRQDQDAQTVRQKAGNLAGAEREGEVRTELQDDEGRDARSAIRHQGS